ncbi:MAG: hypothetical protein AAF366_06270 [Pseudomonadota bacterium]
MRVVMTALAWRRCTAEPRGIIGSILHPDCANRANILEKDLRVVGAVRAADAYRCLRESLALPDDLLRSGMVEWLDEHPTAVRTAQRLDVGLPDISPEIWAYMQASVRHLPNPKVRTRWWRLAARFVPLPA